MLQLLPHVDATQLEQATALLSHPETVEDGASPDHLISPPLLNKKTGIDYWDNFPLTNVADIRRWQQDCQASHENDSPGARSDSQPKLSKLEDDKQLKHSKPLSSTHKRTRSSKPSPLQYSRESFEQAAEALQGHEDELSMDIDPPQQNLSWNSQIAGSSMTDTDMAAIPQLAQQQLFTPASFPGRWINPQTIPVEHVEAERHIETNTQAQSHLFW